MSIPITGPSAVPSLGSAATFNADTISFYEWMSNNATSGGLLYQLNNLSAADFFGVKGTVSETAGVPDGDLFEEGSNANGQYAKLASGLMIQRHTLELVYSSAQLLLGTWTAPDGSTGTNSVYGAIPYRNTTSYTPTAREISQLEAATAGATSCAFRMANITGATNFDPADTADIYVTCISSWY